MRLSESPLYLDLSWRQTVADPVRHVGVYRLDLTGLLREGYIRPERKSSGGLDVRLRIFRADDGSFYVQKKRREEGLLMPNNAS